MTRAQSDTGRPSVEAAARRSARRRLALGLSVALAGIAFSLLLSWLMRNEERQWRRDIDVANSQWTIDCVLKECCLAEYQTWGSLGVLLAGLAITGLLVGYLVLLTGRTARVEQLVAERTRDLHERDRKLVAYEIHDGLSQLLTGALYKFQSVTELQERDPDAARNMFDAAVGVLREALAEARRLISGLRPPVLDELGVVAAIDCLITEHHRHGGPEIEFVHDTPFARVAPPLESAVFRIVQECLTNACRYSQSKKVRVELAQSEGRVRIEVRDWGIGFDPAQVHGDHFGLKGIRERARLLGGAVTLETAPQQGTHIRIELPLLPPSDSETS